MPNTAPIIPFLTEKPQSVRVSQNPSSVITLIILRATTNHIVKFAKTTAKQWWASLGMTMTWLTGRRWSSWWVGVAKTT